MMQILVVGTGCARCAAAEKVVREAVAASGMDAKVSKVSDVMEMLRLGVMSTPAVVIDGRTVCAGCVPTKQQMLDWLSHEAAASSDESCGRKA